jgi:phage-related protein
VAASSSKAASLLSPTSITITGDYATPPVITLDGPVVSPIVISGSFFLMSNRTLIAGEALVIDCSPSAPSIYYRTTAGVLVNDLKNLVLSSTFFQLEKGANSLTFLCNSASVVYSERYLGT